MIERKITIGLITNTEFITQIRKVWEPRFLESVALRTVAMWCVEYYDQYKKAPMRNIEAIFFERLKTKKIDATVANDIQTDVLPSLSEEFEEEHFNLEYTLKLTLRYFNERHLEDHNEKVQALLDKDQVEEAQQLTSSYRPILSLSTSDIDFTDPLLLSKVTSAFSTQHDPLIRYPQSLGDMMNNQLTRGSFVGFMATEKRGKTWWLMDMALRGVRQKCRVAFFQAGDMTEGQFLRRTSIYLAQRSDQERYTGEIFVPIRDCVRNQLDLCTKPEREVDFGVFGDRDEDEQSFRYKITLEEILEKYDDWPEYQACHNCVEYSKNKWGIPWVKPVMIKNPLGINEALKIVNEYFINKHRKLRLSTHLNNTLSVSKIRTILSEWEMQNFIPDVVIIDYADLLVSHGPGEFRHQQNQIWKDLRGLNQELNCLMITATQADSRAYVKNRLDLSNFSEDKRKYAHVTAMYGLNQDAKGREKQLGILYINELLLREGEYDPKSGVYVLQSLKTGRPFMGSYR